jgi:hypothetical protein
MGMAQTINENLRMTWDATIVVVHSTREAIAIAKKHGLTWFDLEEWNATREAWETLGTWATDDAGRWVNIPASER